MARATATTATTQYTITVMKTLPASHSARAGLISLSLPSSFSPPSSSVVAAAVASCALAAPAALSLSLSLSPPHSLSLRQVARYLDETEPRAGQASVHPAYSLAPAQPRHAA